MASVWSYVFVEHGGYDGISSGFDILRDGTRVLTVDVINFFDTELVYDSDTRWEALHARNPEAEALATAIVNCGNMGRLP